MGTVTPAAATSPISAAHAVAVAGAVAMEPIVHRVRRGTIDDAADMIDRRRRRIDHALCDDDGSAAMPAMSVTSSAVVHQVEEQPLAAMLARARPGTTSLYNSW